MDVWTDGQYIQGRHNGWVVPKYFNMPRTTGVIAMEAQNTGGPANLIGYVSEFGLATTNANVRCWLGRSTPTSENIDLQTQTSAYSSTVYLHMHMSAFQTGQARVTTIHTGLWQRLLVTTVKAFGERLKTCPAARTTSGRLVKKSTTFAVDGEWVRINIHKTGLNHSISIDKKLNISYRSLFSKQLHCSRNP